MRKGLRSLTTFDYVNYLIIGILCLVFIYPVLITLAIAVSDPAIPGKITLIPHGFTLDSFSFLLHDARIIRYYLNSVFYALSGTLVFLFFTSLMAYPFIIPTFKGKKVINLFMVITMFFSGGLLPYYFLILNLHMTNTIWVMIIPGAVSAYNVIIFRTFFSSIPGELRESAYIDGARHFTILFRIIIPISKPLLATFALFSMVAKWNDFFTPMIFMRSDALMPIQIFLRKILVLLDFRDAQNRDLQMIYSAITSRSTKCAAVIITIIPIMCVYPFLQKHFAKGIMVGALKA